ncbi:Phenoloxidase subunit 2 [Orchesella cincta]|uniref:Phenoloxidase subunit 2 n=1 Tax=Orchesella cincta TaxID=48709 RepID=A0A1D2N840_ORCCI|nr:Phenoloxidase subunit 2 [Orchesella cincta]
MSKGNGPLNQLRTFWTKKKFELAPSVDKSTDQGGDAHICAVHLAHEPFTFKITIERKSCAKSKSGKGTIRIFMAPRFDEKGRRLHLKEQRRLMFKLDSFQAKLRVGRNIITRRSHDSSLTKPWTKSLRDYEHADPTGAADFCGCGYPQHLYIPKGNTKGMPFDLFVMVTNYDEDHVPNHPKDLEIPETCNSPYIFCGLPKRRYPDARPMGYPWDRPPYKTPIPCLPGHSFASTICKSFNIVFFKPIDSLEQFVARAPNMKSIVFDIKHIDKLIGHHQQERRSYWETTSMEQA